MLLRLSKFIHTISCDRDKFSHRQILYSAFDNYFIQAQRVRQLVRDDFNRIFCIPDVLSHPTGNPAIQGVDVLIHPSAIRTAPPLSPSGNDESGLDAYVQDVLTVPASLAGLPAFSVPACGVITENTGDGWPVGVSVVGQWGCDEMVLRVGEIIEGLNSR